MMLNAFLPGTHQRYAFVGSAMGTIIPAVCFAADAAMSGKTSFFDWAMSGPSQTTLCLMPVWMGLVFLQLGRSRKRLEERMSSKLSTHNQLLYDALHDRLTGLNNRLAFERDAEMWFARKETCSYFLMDLDRFKFVNDTMGHDAGDALLRMLGQRLQQALGQICSIYRLGGDEFLVVVSGECLPQRVESLCQTIITAACDPFMLDAGMVTAGVSIGVAATTLEDTSYSTVLKRADLALYKAKHNEGSCFVVYAEDFGRDLLAIRDFEKDLMGALARDEFFVEYQPIVGVESRAVRSFEALVRWRHPARGVVQPDHFIPLAERTGLIVELGAWVLRQACRDAVSWPAPTGVAVNVAGDQFRNRDFVGFVKRCLAETGLAPGRLTIEITETLFNVDSAALCRCLSELRALGVLIALDDFGTGFSSISRLRDFPVDQLKVDRSFTRAMMSDKRDADVINLILQLGETFDVRATIEGVETENQMEFVRSLGISSAQGFLFSRPVPADQVMDMLAGERANHKQDALKLIA